MKRTLLSSILLLLASSAEAQEKLFDSPVGSIIEAFESFPTDSGDLAVVYVTSSPGAPRTYKTHFLCYAGGHVSKPFLPLKVGVFGFAYTPGSFLFFMRAGTENFIFDIMEVDKLSGEIKRTFRYDLGEERVVGTYTLHGIFHMITVLKKTSEVRVRKFSQAADPITLVYKATKDVVDEIFDKDNHYTFVHNMFEVTLDQVYPNRKMFLFNDKFYLQLPPAKTKSYQVYSGIRFLELAAGQTEGELKIREVPLEHKGKLVSFPVGDRLFLFQSTKTDFSLRVLSLTSFEIVKSYMPAEDGRRLLDGKLQERSRRQYLELDPGDSKAVPTDLTEKLKTLNSTDRSQFIYARELNGNRLMVCMGTYWFSSSGGVTGYNMPGSGTFSMPHSSFYYPRTISAPGASSATTGLPNFNFVQAFLNNDLSLAAYDDSFSFSVDQLKPFANDKENQRASRDYELISFPGGMFLVGFSNQDKTFSVWLWKNR